MHQEVAERRIDTPTDLILGGERLEIGGDRVEEGSRAKKISRAAI